MQAVVMVSVLLTGGVTEKLGLLPTVDLAAVNCSKKQTTGAARNTSSVRHYLNAKSHPFRKAYWKE